MPAASSRRENLEGTAPQTDRQRGRESGRGSKKRMKIHLRASLRWTREHTRVGEHSTFHDGPTGGALRLKSAMSGSQVVPTGKEIVLLRQRTRV